MNPYWYIQNNFTKARSTRIGASNIPALFPNDEKPTESLAGYGQTAVTVWEEKTGKRARPPAGLPAEMGHWNEPKAIELFMREVFGDAVAEEWLIKRMQFEILKKRHPDIDPRDYQEGTILHNTQWYDERFIVHCDGIYDPSSSSSPLPSSPPSIKAFGYTIDRSQPFLVEGKSARFFSARRPAGSRITGYDTDLKTWHGIPLKHYLQIQFQLAMLDVKICYLPLLYDTSSFHVWQIKSNRKIQNQIIDVAGLMAKCIKDGIPPKDLIISIDDIKKLYGEIKEDFVYLTGEERDKAITLVKEKNRATKQIKIWQGKETDSKDALGVMLLDRGELRDEDGMICKWSERKGSERLQKPESDTSKDGFLKYTKKNDPVTFRYLKRKGYISTSEPTRSVTVCKRDIE